MKETSRGRALGEHCIRAVHDPLSGFGGVRPRSRSVTDAAPGALQSGGAKGKISRAGKSRIGWLGRLRPWR